MGDGCNFTDFENSANKSFPVWNFSEFRGNCSFDFDVKIPAGPDKHTEITLKLLFYSLASIANCLLLFIMYKDPLSRFRNSTSYFINNLAVADLVSIVAGMCQSVFQLSIEKHQQMRQEIVACLEAIGVQSSFLIIMIFAIDRYMAIGHPYKFKNIVSRKYILVTLILFPWCFSITTLPVIYFAPAQRDTRTLTNLFAGDIIALTVITLVVHPLTHREFNKKNKRLARSSYTYKNIMEENLKIAKVLAWTVLLVSACLIAFMSPYLIAFCFSLAGCDRCFLSDNFLSFWQYYPLLTSVRLMINSLVYAWRLPLYRQSLSTILVNFKCMRNVRKRSPIRNRVQHFPQLTNTCSIVKDEVVEEEHDIESNLATQCSQTFEINGTDIPVKSQGKQDVSVRVNVNNSISNEDTCL